MKRGMSRLIVTLGVLLLTGQALASGTTNGRGANFLSRVAAGLDWSCAVRDDKEVVCWYGSNGMPDTAGVSEATQVSVAHRSACAVTRIGEVYCWEHGETPLKITGFANGNEGFAVSVLVDTSPASADATCAIVRTGNVYCWGGNEDGQLGDGTNTDRASPVKVKGIANIVALFTGSTRTATLKCGLRITGGVRCWGGGVSTPYAITNMDGVKEIAITMDGVCVWRQIESASNVSCAPPRADLLKNSANFVKLPSLVYPQGLMSNVYGPLCIADPAQTYSWSCMNANYGFAQAPRPGFMTTLTGLDALVFGDMEHSCATFADGSVRCMNHGMISVPCDIATRGVACNTAPSHEAPGTWSLVPNLLLVDGGKPRMFGDSGDQRFDARTGTSMTISWKSPPETTNHYAQVCDGNMKCRVISSAVTKVGDRYSVTANNLRRDSRYIFLVDPYNWASVQGNFGIESRTLP